MLSMIDIKKSINDVLKEHISDVPIVGNSVEEGFEKPAFFTQLMPVTTNVESTKLLANRFVIAIIFFAKDKTQTDKNKKSLENLKMIDRLKDAFIPSIKIKDRNLTISKIEFDDNNGFLSFSFNLNFKDDIEIKETYPIMKELYFDEGVER